MSLALLILAGSQFPPFPSAATSLAPRTSQRCFRAAQQQDIAEGASHGSTIDGYVEHNGCLMTSKYSYQGYCFWCVPGRCSLRFNSMCTSSDSLLVRDARVAAMFAQQTASIALVSMSHIAAGEYHSVVVLEDGNVIAFGLNRGGQCNVPTAE
eukprot:1532291-Amphidinium_carterae.1